jgi:hypothetical protein
MTFINNIAPNARPGQFIQVDPMGRLIRVSDSVTSWSATTYRVNQDGTLSLSH